MAFGYDRGRSFAFGHFPRSLLLIEPGTVAPDFALSNQNRETVTLSSFRGKKNVVVAFHPLAFTPVCSVQMKTYERERPKLDALDTHVLALSIDAGPSKKAWADSLGGVSYDLLSDFHPHGKVAADYGVMRDDGISERAIFVVDKAGVVRWARQYAIPEQPDLQELLHALEQL
jgi:peroxiredoxin (alkyl hydroperoxide reductase subunit C)